VKTRCPACATSFRVGPEQLKARSGKVRCGQCGSVFNALDTLLDEVLVVAAPAMSSTEPASAPQAHALIPADEPAALQDFAATDANESLAADEGVPDGEPASAHDRAPEPASQEFANWPHTAPFAATASSDDNTNARATTAAEALPFHNDQPGSEEIAPEELIAAPGAADSDESNASRDPHDDIAPATDDALPQEAAAAPETAQPAPSAALGTLVTAAHEAVDTPPAASSAPVTAVAGSAALAVPAAALAADGGVLPRQMTEIPGYSKWSEGAIAQGTTSVDSVAAPASQTTFVVVAGLLALLLAGQAVFHFRSEIAASAPSLQRALITYADLFGTGLPPLRRAEMISIEGSDLQADPARRGQLMLLATLANRAPYAQALPLLELTLTDTHDQAVARKVFTPEQYLPDAAAAGTPFAPRSEIALRLPIETRDIAAAGYRLYVFYP